MGSAEAEQALAEWKQNADRRDELIRAAYAAGVNIRRISQLSGLSRNTVYRVLGVEAGSDETDT